jgi:hypothetical protein
MWRWLGCGTAQSSSIKQTEHLGRGFLQLGQPLTLFLIETPDESDAEPWSRAEVILRSRGTLKAFNDE